MHLKYLPWPLASFAARWKTRESPICLPDPFLNSMAPMATAVAGRALGRLSSFTDGGPHSRNSWRRVPGCGNEEQRTDSPSWIPGTINHGRTAKQQFFCRLALSPNPGTELVGLFYYVGEGFSGARVHSYHSVHTRVGGELLGVSPHLLPFFEAGFLFTMA